MMPPLAQRGQEQGRTRWSRSAFEKISAARGSAGPPLLDHDTGGGEPLDCSIVEAVLAKHLVRVLREFGWR
jgi:hypothetical protein